MSTNVINQETVKKLSDILEYQEVRNKAEGNSSKTISRYSANLKIFGNYLKNSRS